MRARELTERGPDPNKRTTNRNVEADLDSKDRQKEGQDQAGGRGNTEEKQGVPVSC